MLLTCGLLERSLRERVAKGKENSSRPSRIVLSRSLDLGKEKRSYCSSTVAVGGREKLSRFGK